MSNKADKNGRHIREGSKEELKRLTKEDRKLYKKCLYFAGLNEKYEYDKIKGIEYFNAGTIPLSDAIKRFEDVKKKWEDCLEQIGDLVLESINEQRKMQHFGSIGGRKSSRKPDQGMMRNAILLITKIRIERNYKDSYQFEGHTKFSVYNSLKEKGFTGTYSWVKKHFDTITRVSISSIK
jgi:hypothetical protein